MAPTELKIQLTELQQKDLFNQAHLCGMLQYYLLRRKMFLFICVLIIESKQGTIKNKNRLTRTDDLFDQLKGSQFFSKLI